MELAIAESKRKGIERRIVDDVEIVERLVLAMVAEAAVLVAEGVVRHPGDVDVAMIHGFGFPRHTGGPLWWASGLESNCLSRGLQRLTEVSGEPVPHDLIAEMLRKVRHDG
ncbi:3-hydroxyacyl-CoA dehydrogenase family protein [Aeromicrobium sp. UC242_57]|uniref:3-hydroxyacyl-CoA dehydrogenase family protein n=1 Tax=Aeromicrobium sp. UC242_57 TaxID=3374624 RepID=UPI0037B6DC8C